MLKNAKKRSLANLGSASASMRATRERTFTCSAELLGAFEQRASEMGCSLDWLLEESMQRLLAEMVTDRRMDRPEAPPILVEPEPEPAPLVLDADGERFVIDRQPFVVGRSPSAAQLVIDDGLVSRRHAAFERQPDGWAITDLGSTNGIIIDSETVRHAYLRPGTVMSIGPMTFVVVSS